MIESLEKDSKKKKSSRSRSRSRSSSPVSFARGDKIKARYKGKSKYYEGKIARDNKDGTYDVNYDDGEKEKDVKADLIESLEKDSMKGKSSSSRSRSRSNSPSSSFSSSKDRLLSIKITKALAKLQSRSKSDGSIRAVFNKIDKDSSGSISSSEFKKFLSKIGCDLSSKECKELVQVMDADNNGSIDLSEFLNFVLSDVLEGEVSKRSVDRQQTQLSQLTQI